MKTTLRITGFRALFTNRLFAIVVSKSLCKTMSPLRRVYHRNIRSSLTVSYRVLEAPKRPIIMRGFMLLRLERTDELGQAS